MRNVRIKGFRKVQNYSKYWPKYIHSKSNHVFFDQSNLLKIKAITKYSAVVKIYLSIVPMKLYSEIFTPLFFQSTFDITPGILVVMPSTWRAFNLSAS
jgi:hypothetical protein